jgi:hypothetical protein
MSYTAEEAATASKNRAEREARESARWEFSVGIKKPNPMAWSIRSVNTMAERMIQIIRKSRGTIVTRVTRLMDAEDDPLDDDVRFVIDLLMAAEQPGSDRSKVLDAIQRNSQRSYAKSA